MANFNEHALKLSIMELFKNEGYICLGNEQRHREFYIKGEKIEYLQKI